MRHLGLADALDGDELLLGRVCDALDGVVAHLLELAQVRRGNAAGLKLGDAIDAVLVVRNHGLLGALLLSAHVVLCVCERLQRGAQLGRRPLMFGK